MSSESREEFRKRIGTTAHAAMKLPDFSEFEGGDLIIDEPSPQYWKEPFETGDPCHHIPMQKTDFYDVAEAVYAQALRDLLVLTYVPPSYGAAVIHVSHLRAFAAERGITLENES